MHVQQHGFMDGEASVRRCMGPAEQDDHRYRLLKDDGRISYGIVGKCEF